MSSENLDAAVVTWYCQTDRTWEPYPADICDLLEREHQHVRQGTSVVGGVIHWNFSRKNQYEIDVSHMQQKNIKTGQLRAVMRTASPALRCLGVTNHICMIARQMDGHNSVMIRATCSGRSRIRWWLLSGSRVLAAMQSDTTEYVLIFPDPSMAHCWDPLRQLLTHWPRPQGYIKKHNLATPEEWRSESRSEPVMLPLMDLDRGIWTGSMSRRCPLSLDEHRRSTEETDAMSEWEI